MTDQLVTPNYSHTLLSTWRRCRYKFQLRYLEGIPDVAGIGQIKGSAGHAALADWLANRDTSSSLQAGRTILEEGCVANGLDPYSDAADAAWAELSEALLRYYEFSEHNDTFTLIQSELQFVIDVNGYPFKGFIDAVVRDNAGRVWLMEHKFYKRVETGSLDLDPQVGLYMLAATLLGLEPTGIVYNIVRVGSGPTAKKDPVVRKWLYRNREGLRTVATELQTQIAEIAEWVATPDRRVYRNATKDCMWDCPYNRVCLAIEDSGSGEPVLDRMKQIALGGPHE